MKKLYLAIILGLIVLSNVVFADGAPPRMYYDAVISNPNGAAFYIHSGDAIVQKGKLNQGTVVTINTSYEKINNEVYVYADWYASSQSERTYDVSNYAYGLIQFKDMKKKEPWKLSDISFDKVYMDKYVLGKEGVSIYEWPSLSEKIIGQIPDGEFIKVKNAYEKQYNEIDGWYYVEYKGVKGWISNVAGATGTKNENSFLISSWRGARMYDKDGNIVGKIAPNTIFKDYYIIDYGSNYSYYVEYKGENGYIKSNEIGSGTQSEISNYTVKYDGAVLIRDDGTFEDVPKGTILQYTANFYYKSRRVIYTNYNGNSGWLFYEYYDETSEYYQKNVNEIKEIMNKIINHLDEEYYYEEEKVEENKNDNIPTTTSAPIVIEKVSSDDFGLTPTEVLYICVLCAIIASLLTTILIVGMNKSFNKKILLVLIPIAIILTILTAFIFFNANKAQNSKIESNSYTNISETPVENIEVTDKEEVKELPVLRTKYTKNFFKLGEYAREWDTTYSSDGNKYGYIESYRTSDTDYKATSSAMFNGRVSASSTLAPQGNFSYEVEHIVNGNRENTWVEGVDGYGIGEYVEITYPNFISSDRLLKELCIVNGYAQTMTKWEKNSRVKKLKLYYEGKPVATVDLIDTISPQYIDISSLNLVIKAKSEATFKFEIMEVYEEGGEYADTAITGIVLN